ncbi:MAG: glycosyltransferase [Phycisphaera sp.]|nr:glycosyltransferase [Phycisphaera sp.]
MTRHTQDKPCLLMLSHCLPDAMGQAERARAWQLLRVAGLSHRVLLASVTDGPIHMQQWRSAKELAHALVIQPRSWTTDALGRLTSLTEPSWAGRLMGLTAVNRLARSWAGGHEIDAIVCTHPSMWGVARSLEAPVRICDLWTPRSALHRRAERESTRPVRSWHRHRAEAHLRWELEVASECDTLTVGCAEYGHRYLTSRCKTLVLPEAVDLSCYHEELLGHRPEESRVNVVVHADCRHEHGRSATARFARTLWPRIAKAVPNAALRIVGQTFEAVRAYRDAALVVSPHAEPGLARFPMLQAMAMRRPVVAHSESTQDMGVRHGEHALLAKDDRDWADACIEALRSRALRLSISHHARAFVEQLCPMQLRSNTLATALAGPTTISLGPLARAA